MTNLDDILNPDKCPDCNGAGMITMAMGSVICPKCKGTGKKPIVDDEPLEPELDSEK